MGTKAIWIFLALLVTWPTEAQEHKTTDEQQRQLLCLTKQLFPINPLFSYFLTTSSIKSSFEQVDDAPVYDNYFLANYLDSLEQEPQNPRFLYQAGQFYLKNGYPKTASGCYLKALEFMSIRYFDGDSARYYSFRAMLRLRLDDRDVFDDITRSLRINPSDSLASSFYYPALLSAGKFDQLQQSCAQVLDAGCSYPETFLFYLFFSIVFERMQQENLLQQEDKQRFLTVRKITYSDYYDCELFSHYAAQYANKTEANNMALLGELLLLLLKGGANTDFHEIEQGLYYTPEEAEQIWQLHHKLTELYKQHQLNAYAACSALGYTNLMLKNYDQAIRSFKKAIRQFPKQKQTKDYNPADAYAGLSTIYYIQRDTISIQQNLERKLKDLKPEFIVADDYLLLAKCALYQGNYPLSENYCIKAIEKQADCSEALRLRAHLFFLMHNLSMAFDYIAQAQKAVSSRSDEAQNLLQLGIYQFILSDYNQADRYFRLARIVMDNPDWKICDTVQEMLATVLADQ